MRKLILAATALAALATPAWAQYYQGRATTDQLGNTTFYGPSGQLQGRSMTDQLGNTTYYGPAGQLQGRSMTDQLGNTTFYGSPGWGVPRRNW